MYDFKKAKREGYVDNCVFLSSAFLQYNFGSKLGLYIHGLMGVKFLNFHHGDQLPRLRMANFQYNVSNIFN